ncbi:MAG TPA: type III polyketide synthase [Chitinophagaceae bacterium]|nr:type III polyketide synthase [Chitinophagaceae bacterium]
MSKIISIGTALPQHRHEQETILQFMQQLYGMDDIEKRKLRFLYRHSGINTRYSCIADYSRPMQDWKFYPQSENIEPFPTLEQRMDWYQKFAPPLSVHAIRKCLDRKISEEEITHFITVSCTGMSAPGLDLQVMELMDLRKDIFRTSVNFMGCYAALHALKMADMICRSTPDAKVLIVCTELCTLHLQKEVTQDNLASGLLFADGSAAVVVTGDEHPTKGISLKSFYSEVVTKGKKDMSWELSSTGFQMTLSGYVPDLIEEDIEALVDKALSKQSLTAKDISQWCIHPGGKKILEAVQKSLGIGKDELKNSYHVLEQYGNMSSASILFVLKEMMHNLMQHEGQKIFGVAFGPGLTMETFIAES